MEWKNIADNLYPTLRSRIDNVLRELGSEYLVDGTHKERWTPEQPETGYCHPISEVLYRCGLMPPGTVIWSVPTPAPDHPNSTHYALRIGNTTDIIDFTDQQYFAAPLDYSKGQVCPIEETAEERFSLPPKVSQRIHLIASKLGLTLTALCSL